MGNDYLFIYMFSVSPPLHKDQEVNNPFGFPLALHCVLRCKKDRVKNTEKRVGGVGGREKRQREREREK